MAEKKHKYKATFTITVHGYYFWLFPKRYLHVKRYDATRPSRVRDMIRKEFYARLEEEGVDNAGNTHELTIQSIEKVR